MHKYGLIGYPLGHSFSKKYFQHKFIKESITHASYESYPIPNCDTLLEMINRKNLSGLNVTIPHKQNVIPFLDELDSTAQGVGAVNCIKIVRTRNLKKTIGYNTDFYAFGESLKPLLEYKVNALILGNGGAALAVKYALQRLNIDFKIVTRKNDEYLNYENLDDKLLKKYFLIINTTPLGAFPNIEECPMIDYESITSKHILFDLIYNPSETLFLKKGKSKGAVTKNGYEMLVLQAEKSWELWSEK